MASKTATAKKAPARKTTPKPRQQTADRAPQPKPGPPAPSVKPKPPIRMTSTEAQNGFGKVLDAVARDETVIITKHNAPHAVVMSHERYAELTRSEAPTLNDLAAEFDALFERMQGPDADEAFQAAFSMSPAELGRVAVEAAKRGAR